jgi:hypothetical protein
LPERLSAAGLAVDWLLNDAGEAIDTVAINSTSDNSVIIFRNCIFPSPDISVVFLELKPIYAVRMTKVLRPDIYTAKHEARAN